jgi:hypothetical protein
MKFHYELFADYHQFYLQDEGASGNLSDAWTPAASERLLALAECTIGVGTVRSMTVPVTVEIVDAAPTDEWAVWDHVNECSIEIPSGRIVIAGCTDYFPDAARIELTPGCYRARVYYGGLKSLSEDGLSGEDHYEIVLWPGDPIEPRVLKQHTT